MDNNDNSNMSDESDGSDLLTSSSSSWSSLSSLVQDDHNAPYEFSACNEDLVSLAIEVTKSRAAAGADTTDNSPDWHHSVRDIFESYFDTGDEMVTSCEADKSLVAHSETNSEWKSRDKLDHATPTNENNDNSSPVRMKKMRHSESSETNSEWKSRDKLDHATPTNENNDNSSPVRRKKMRHSAMNISDNTERAEERVEEQVVLSHLPGLPTDPQQMTRFLSLPDIVQREVLLGSQSTNVPDHLLSQLTSQSAPVSSQVACVWLQCVFLNKLLLDSEVVSRELSCCLLLLCAAHGRAVCDSLLLPLSVTHDHVPPTELRSALVGRLHDAHGAHLIECMCEGVINSSVVTWLLELLPVVPSTSHLTSHVVNACVRCPGAQLKSISFSRLLLCVVRHCAASLQDGHAGALQSLSVRLQTALARAVQSACRRLSALS